MSGPRLIALCSNAQGAGKSSVRDCLVHTYDFNFIAFATPLKTMFATLLSFYGYSKAECSRRIFGADADKAEVIPELGTSARHALQTLGTEWGRHYISSSIWVDAAMAQATKVNDAGGSIVIDDCRFPNELEAVHEAGGEVWYISRAGAEDGSGHASEGAIEPWHCDRVLMNEGSLFDLENGVAHLMQGEVFA